MSQNKKLVVLMLVLAALIVVSVYVWQSGILLKKQQTAEVPQNQIDYTKPTPQVLNIVKNDLFKDKISFSFPDTSSVATTSLKNLPKPLSVFVPTDYTNGEFEKISYVGGKNGYLISYIVNQYLVDFFPAQLQALSLNKDWQKGTSTWAQVFGFMEWSNPTYQVRIEHSLTGDNKDQVVVRVLTK